MNSPKKDQFGGWLDRIKRWARGSSISSTTDWETLVEAVKHSQDTERAVRASKVIARVADKSRLSELHALLQNKDFFVRETAAEPLAHLEGVRALPALFRAVTRGVADGQDNDALTTIIVDVIETDKVAALPILLNMLKSADKTTRANAAWGLRCYGAEISPQPLLDALDDPDPQVQAAAAKSLESFRHHPQVFEALLAKSHTQTQSVRDAAIKTLDVITNIDRTNESQKDVLDLWFKPSYGGERVFRLFDLLQVLTSDPRRVYRKLGPVLLVDLILLITLIVMFHLLNSK